MLHHLGVLCSIDDQRRAVVRPGRQVSARRHAAGEHTGTGFLGPLDEYGNNVPVLGGDQRAHIDRGSQHDGVHQFRDPRGEGLEQGALDVGTRRRSAVLR
ncbi:hypothetical protein GCM10025778_29830 [Paeniglutamicibacter antarcticus]|uniref:Uncharacterized protein n=1 Tax=Paeniglutamicibacter antarcticus TaxID=494023 RepID=A0ABP9TNY9_9MICC